MLLILIKISIVERIPVLLHLYGYKDVHLLVPAPDVYKCHMMHRHCHAEHFFTNGSYFPGVRNPELGWHMALTYFVSKHINYEILFIHGDMYVNRERIRQYPKDAIWLPFNPMRSGPTGNLLSGSKCTSFGDMNNDNEWHWWGTPPVGVITPNGHGKPMCKRVMRSFGAEQCCYGWVDMIHIPSWATLPFVKYMEHMSNLHCEIAVTSTFYLINRFDVLFVPCIGNCCEQVEWGTAKNATCAHKIDLQDVQQRLLMHLVQKHRSTFDY